MEMDNPLCKLFLHFMSVFDEALNSICNSFKCNLCLSSGDVKVTFTWERSTPKKMGMRLDGNLLEKLKLLCGDSIKFTMVLAANDAELRSSDPSFKVGQGQQEANSVTFFYDKIRTSGT